MRADGGLADRLAPEFALALGAISRVARALVGAGTLVDLGERALSEMRDALDLDTAVLYLPATGEPTRYERYVECREAEASVRARDELAFDEDALRLTVAGGSPLVFHSPGSWLVDNPFVPPAGSWLVLPLVARDRPIGLVVAAGSAPVRLDPAGATLLALLGDLLGAGVANARLRQEAQRAEVERDRVRLAAEVHDGLAQDLALAVRELALLDSAPEPDVAKASGDRLRAAVASAHRVVRARLEDLTVHVPLGGIGPAAEELCARFAHRGLLVRFSAAGPAADVEAETAAVALRVLSEALANVARHAGAGSARVELCVDRRRLRLVVDDDGRGFDPAAAPSRGDGHFGLAIMRQRALAVGGGLAVEPSPAGGARVVLEVPVASASAPGPGARTLS